MIFEHSSEVLPPILEECVRQALSQGRLFSCMNSLPMPNFPVKRKDWGDLWSCRDTSSVVFSVEPAHKRYCNLSYDSRSESPAGDVQPKLLASHQMPESNYSTELMKKKDSDSSDESANRQKPCRIVLTASLAREIYNMRPALGSGSGRHSKSGTALSREIGQRYEVSGKTVRDIWSRITWTEATQDLWTVHELHAFLTSPRATTIATSKRTKLRNIDQHPKVCSLPLLAMDS
mmetsp:Transcript_81849/g.219815  ORF Transcript_81849/g.219815 Transcript_81849/m.219815 type:complete len:233 (-) Transcript_81849:135-833(-)